MRVLSVDLSRNSWSALGVVLLESEDHAIRCNIIRWLEPYPPPVVELAQRLDQLCLNERATVLMLDGPQAAKSSRSGTALNGAPNRYERFTGYCLALYLALDRLGWRRRPMGEARAAFPKKLLIESYPDAAWRLLGIPPLPAKAECRVSQLAQHFSELAEILPIITSQPPNHSQLQAIVGGLSGLSVQASRRMKISQIEVLEHTFLELLRNSGVVTHPSKHSSKGKPLQALIE